MVRIQSPESIIDNSTGFGFPRNYGLSIYRGSGLDQSPRLAQMRFKILKLLNIILAAAVACHVAGALAAAPGVPWPPPAGTVSWQQPAAADLPSALTLRVLTFNDF